MQLVIIGAGGLGREVAALAAEINHVASCPQWEVLGFIDDNPDKFGLVVGHFQILGSRAWLLQHPEVWAVLAIGNGEVRQKLASELPGVKWATLIHPQVSVFSSSKPSVAAGTVIFNSAVLSTDVAVGAHCIIYYGCTISHDVTVNDVVTMLPGCNVAGDVEIGTAATLGIGSKVAHNVRIGAGACLAAGAVVVKDVPARCLAAGAPATVQKSTYSARQFWQTRAT